MFSSELTEGSSVQVLCGVSSGDKPVYFSWLKDEAPLPANLQVFNKVYEICYAMCTVLQNPVRDNTTIIQPCVGPTYASYVEFRENGRSYTAGNTL